MKQEGKRFSLMAQFNRMFTVFVIVAMTFSGVVSYINQTRFYHSEVKRNMEHVADYLNVLFTAQGNEFARLKEYFVTYRDELLIPFDFSGDYSPARDNFERLWSAHYPGQAAADMPLADMVPEVRRAYGLYLYEFWFYQMEQARTAFDVKYTYFVYPVSEEDHIMCYMFDGFRDKDTRDGQDYILLGAEAQEDPGALFNKWTAWTTGRKPASVDVQDNKYGHVFIYSEPVYINGEKIGLVCVEVLVESVNQAIWSMTVILVVLLCVALLIPTTVMLWWIRNKVLRRLDGLEKHVAEYSVNKDVTLADTMEKELEAGMKSSRHEDEITILAIQFVQMIRELETYMQNIQAVTADRERIATELNVATNIQASMLPNIFPAFPERDEFDLFASMTPAKEVGGDFYDFFMTDENHMALVIADVSGKGIPAALFMVIAKTLIKNHTQMGKPPEIALRDANNQLCEGNSESMFVTAWLGLLDLVTGDLSFSDAGHETPFILRADGEVELLKPRRKVPPLAIMDGLKYRENHAQLNVGDSLFLYTDGVPEATDANEELYGMERLEAFLRLHTSDAPQNLLEAVHENVNQFVGDAPQFDDLTMLGMQIRSLAAPKKDENADES